MGIDLPSSVFNWYSLVRLTLIMLSFFFFIIIIIFFFYPISCLRRQGPPLFG